MNDPKHQPPHLTSEEAALERELERLRPAKVPPVLRDMTLGALKSTNLSAEEMAFAQSLGRLRPTPPSAQLWESIEAKLGSTEDIAEPDNLISMPKWRDFAPIFKAAAMVAIGLFAAVSILRPTAEPPATSVSTEAPSMQLVPISRTGTIQNTRRVQFMEQGKQIYEQRLETRKDRSHYHLSPDLQVEDEVTRQTKVYSPMRTF